MSAVPSIKEGGINSMFSRTIWKLPPLCVDADNSNIYTAILLWFFISAQRKTVIPQLNIIRLYGGSDSLKVKLSHLSDTLPLISNVFSDSICGGCHTLINCCCYCFFTWSGNKNGSKCTLCDSNPDSLPPLQFGEYYVRYYDIELQSYLQLNILSAGLWCNVVFKLFRSICR